MKDGEGRQVYGAEFDETMRVPGTVWGGASGVERRVRSGKRARVVVHVYTTKNRGGREGGKGGSEFTDLRRN
mgnify:CR=1 FL=1